MRVYLAAAYARRKEMQNYAQIIRSRDHMVTSRWIMGPHQQDPDGNYIGEVGEKMVEGVLSPRLCRHLAWNCILDIRLCNYFLLFNDPELPSTGRHVELGVALQHLDHGSIGLVGRDSSLFHSLIPARFYTFEDWWEWFKSRYPPGD